MNFRKKKKHEILLWIQVKVSHHDSSPVLVTDETKWITIGKVLNRWSDKENVAYFKFALDATGTANVKIPTSSKEESFYLEVRVSNLKSKFP